EEKEQTSSSLQSRIYLAGLGIFCILVAGTAIYSEFHFSSIYFRSHHKVTHHTQQDVLVKGDRALLRREMEELSRETEQLSQKTEFIQKFDTFSVKDNCPNKRCKPCLQDWIIFKKKCYLFYNEPAPWKTWEQSRRFCQDRRADLVVIDDLEEQEFVNKHINHDKHNGYWMGLQHLNSKWTWVDGRADTLGFWMKQTVTTPAPKALVVPRQNPSESWKKADNVFLNKFICEHNARLSFLHESSTVS
uniref:C-type lectin domain-containing protein n=1 Tax=Poecilia formosa TaxID=48698 RepID=A0A096MFM3_POEFO